MRTPKWAENLVLDALIHLEEQGHKVPAPIIRWHKRHGCDSSGHASGDTITINAGKDRTDTKLVVLHEVAHLVTKCEPQYWNIERAKKNGWIFSKEPTEPIIMRNISHTAKFWDVAWNLYRWAKLPIRYCQRREYPYKVGAQAAYKRNRKEGK